MTGRPDIPPWGFTGLLWLTAVLTVGGGPAAVTAVDSGSGAEPGGGGGGGGVENQLIGESRECAADFAVLRDICRLTPEMEKNNWAILDCLQNPPKEISLSAECDHYLWQFKLEITKKDRFLQQAQSICAEDIDKLRLCTGEEDKPGHFLACLVENKREVHTLPCSHFLTRVETIIFSDYRLVANFMNACQASVEKFQCGRTKVPENDIHSQGKTIACLSNKIDQVDPKCREEILTIAELQAEDVHLDAALFSACREDVPHFCEGVQPGEGRIYDCLIHHKMEPGMSENCRAQISRRQSLAAQDYRVAGGLTKACKPEIKKHKCRKGVSDSHEIVKMSQIIICLMDAKLEGETLSGKCEFEIEETRRAIMQDFSITPEIIKDCHTEIASYCGRSGKNGQTLHCLMQLTMDKSPQKVMGEACENTLKTLVREVSPNTDWRADPVLEESCSPVVSAVCNPAAGGDAVMSCLMENLARETGVMTRECRAALMQIHYFLAREAMVDEDLYRGCRSDAKRLCQAGDGWHKKDGDPRTKLVFPCLVRSLYIQDEDDDDDDDDDEDEEAMIKQISKDESPKPLSETCADQVERVLRQRAVSVQLHPEIEAVCRTFLHTTCTTHTGPGEELGCLQDNLSSLPPSCKKAVVRYTKMEAKNIYLNPLVFKACGNVIEKFCGAEDKARNGAGVMECLVRHSIEHGPGSGDSMSGKCRHVVEHWQILTLQDWRFSFQFKDACKDEIREHCVTCTSRKDCKGPNTKLEVLECLSKVVLNDTVYEGKHRVKKACRAELKFELLQKHSSIKLDPAVSSGCRRDLEKFCPNEIEDNALECLKEQKHKRLSESCRKVLFQEEEEEAVDNDVDFALMRGCKKEIKEHCMSVNSSNILQCLEEFSADFNFDPKCEMVLKKRVGQKMRDYRLNPALTRACRGDINKYCKSVLVPGNPPDFYEGKVVECLTEKYAQNINLLSKKCRHEIKGAVRETAARPEANPLSGDLCPLSREQCRLDTEAAIAAGDHELAGRLRQECLWMMLEKGTLKDGPECQHHISVQLEAVRRDIHADPVLLEACAVDLVKFCREVPNGEGRRLGCLVMASRERNFGLEPKCEKLLNARVDMFNMAVKVNPVEGAYELYESVMGSQHRNYFLSAIGVIILVIFVFGLCFGRVTKRVRSEAKNR